MAGEPSLIVTTWRTELPSLTGRAVTLREPAAHDLAPLHALMLLADSSRFGLDEPLSELGVQDFIERAGRDRAAGIAFVYAITLTASRTLVGLLQVRQLDPSFEAA